MTKKTRRTDGLVTSYNLEIIQRFMSEAELKQFTEKYKGAQLFTSSAIPTKQELKIADMYFVDKYTFSEIARKIKLSQARVTNTVNKVARYYHKTK